jgi:hypothetical protein
MRQLVNTSGYMNHLDHDEQMEHGELYYEKGYFIKAKNLLTSINNTYFLCPTGSCKIYNEAIMGHR